VDTLYATKDADTSWMQSRSKSLKTCTVDADNVFPIESAIADVTCTSVNAHWFRNMATKELDEDVQLSVAGDPTSTYKAFGYQQTYIDTIFAT